MQKSIKKLELKDLIPSLETGANNFGFLFGAGASFEAGYPLTMMLTQSVIKRLNKEELSLLESIFKSYNTRFSSANYSIHENLPDIELILNLVNEFKIFNNNPTALSLYAGLETKIKDLIVDELISVKSPDLKYHIKFLSIIKNMIGARAEPFWIFTTNYDMLFETAAMHVELPIRNGFEGCCARYFDMQRMKLKTGTLTRHSPGASRFEEHKEPYAKLIKLHGSISWYKNDKNTYELFGDNSIGSEYQRVLIHPQNYKVTQTLDSPYDKLFQYSGEVLGNRCNYLVTCGYSYRDQHINDRLLIPKLKTGKLRIFALFEQEPENIEDFKKHSAFNYLTKDKLYMNKKECAHPNDLWKFSKLVDFLSS